MTLITTGGTSHWPGNNRNEILHYTGDLNHNCSMATTLRQLLGHILNVLLNIFLWGKRGGISFGEIYYNL